MLDFGLAKVAAPATQANQSRRRRQRSRLRIREKGDWGTAAYMSPEQARGKTLDKRTDIWAFGGLLEPDAHGQRVFAGETVSGTIAAILNHETNWNALPAQTPVSIRRLLQRCLEKVPKRRLRDVGDARLEIEEALGAIVAPTGAAPAVGASDRVTPAARDPTRLAWWAAAGVGLLIIGKRRDRGSCSAPNTSGGVRWKARRSRD